MISIIGGGPAGNYLAALLAKNGEEVCVYEEHDEIGKPVQCAGIVTSELDKFVEVKKEFLVNKARKFKLFLVDNCVDIKVKPNYVLDRGKFDRYLAKKAMKYGAEYKLGWKFLGLKNGKLKFNKGLKKTDILVGSDGVFSKVAKEFGLCKDRKFAVAAQITCKKKVDKNVVETYFDEGYFGWVVPESSDRVRVGIGARDNIEVYFKNFLNKIGVKGKKFQSGFIPVYDPKAKICKDNVYLLGDAALQVKPASGGGIIQGLMAAQELCKSILYCYDYGKLCKKRLGLDLYVSLLARRKLDKFTRNDFEKIYNLISQDKIRKVFGSYERDYAWKLMLNSAIREPRFLKFLF